MGPGAIIPNNGTNLPDWTVLDSWIFKNFILASELFTKSSRSLETYLLVKILIYMEI